MNERSKIYINGFLYFLYFVFFIHFFISTPIEELLAHYSAVGVYFSYGFICLMLIKKWLDKRFIKETETVKLFSQLRVAMMSQGLWILPVLLLSHILALIGIITSFTYWLTKNTLINQNLIIFLIGCIFFALGLKCWKSQNKKILIPVMMTLFIHGIYNGLLWHSLSQQEKVYEAVYEIALKDNINLVECGKTISCSQVEVQNIIPSSHLEKIQDLTLKIHLKRFLTDFVQKIEKAKRNNSPEIVVLAFPDNLISFLSMKYQPIGLYDIKSNKMIVDFDSMYKVTKVHQIVYEKITGVAILFWFALMLIMIFWHYMVKKVWMRGNK